MAEEVESESITEAQLSKQFKEYSIAEFFKRNRQMLGYSGKVRSLTTIVHELCTNSVTWDTPSVVKIDGQVMVVQIGELIDKLMADNTVEYLPSQEVESLRRFKNFYVLCFDKNTLNLKFKQVKSLHRHQMEEDEKLIKIKLVGGRSVEITKHHSVFTLREGKVIALKGEDIQVGDSLVVPRKTWAGSEIVKEINLLEDALKLSNDELGDFSLFGVKDLLYNNRDVLDKIKAPLTSWQKNHDFYANYMKCDRLPVKLLRALTKDERAIFYNCKIGYRQSKSEMRVNCILSISPQLMRFLGLYVAEGNTRNNLRGVSLSLGSHERDLIETTKNLVRTVFGIEANEKVAHNTAVNVTIDSKTIAFIIANIFKCGKKAKEKRVPEIVFNISPELAAEFLYAYLAGDGYPSKLFTSYLNTGILTLKSKITLATASKELCTSLEYLLSSLGYSYSKQLKPAEQRVVNGINAQFSESHIIEFYLSQKNSPLNYYPIEIGGIEKITEPKMKYSIRESDQKTIMYQKMLSLQGNQITLNADALNFIKGDLGVLSVVSLEERAPKEGEYVYDYSIDGDENFVGGYGAICLHNSLDSAEEAGKLPDITIEIQELPDGHVKVIAEDNGTGIPKKNIGQAFGKLLAGTKFHQRKQKRGQQGIGVSYAVLFSQLTTGKTTRVKTGTGNYKVYECDISIDVKSNTPVIVNEQEYSKNYQGVKIEFEFAEVTYNRSEYSVYEYLRRTALANPHCQITLIEPNKEVVVFPRATKDIPKKPKSILPHPLGISTSDLIEMAHASKSRKISSFLTTEFSRFSSDKVKEISSLLSTVNFDRAPSALTWPEAEAIVKTIQKLKWIAPETDALRPIGEKQIEKSLENLLEPEQMKVVERKPKVFRGGIPFLVEAAIAYGGKAGAKQGDAKGEILRFANRTPLLFDAGACATAEAVKTIDWARYDLKDWENLPISIFINFVSVHVPYTGAGKLAISTEEEIVQEIRFAIMECARDVSVYLNALKRAKEQEQRRQVFFKYIGEVSEALQDLTGNPKKEIEAKLRKIAEQKTALLEAEENGEEEKELEEMEEAAEKEIEEEWENPDK